MGENRITPGVAAALGLWLAFALPSELPAVPTEPFSARLTPIPDSDGDGIPDTFDGCPGIANVEPNDDSDGDWLRDECDLDPDGDGRLGTGPMQRVARAWSPTPE